MKNSKQKDGRIAEFHALYEKIYPLRLLMSFQCIQNDRIPPLMWQVSLIKMDIWTIERRIINNIYKNLKNFKSFECSIDFLTKIKNPMGKRNPKYPFVLSISPAY